MASDDMFVPFRAEFGGIQGLELGAHYWYLDVPGDSTGWRLNAKYVFPEFVKKLGLAVGGHYKEQSIGDLNNDGHDLYFVASYPSGFLVPTLGFMYESITGDNDESDFRAFASLVGNVLTRHLFRLLAGRRVTDTQSGLRCFSLSLAPRFLRLEGERYEYEMSMLIEAHRTAAIREVGISTVYIATRLSHYLSSRITRLPC